MPELWDAYDNHFNRIEDIIFVKLMVVCGK